MPRYVLWSLLCLICSLSVMTLSAQESNGRVIEMWESLNMRATPANDSAVVAELAGETALIVTGRLRTNAWYQVQTLDGLSGWVSASFVNLNIDLGTIPIIEPNAAPAPVTAPPSEPQAAAPVVVGAGNGLVTAGLLNLRAAPTRDADVLARLPNGTRITAVERTPDTAWLRVQSGLGEGWVSAQYIRLDVDIAALPAGETGIVSDSGAQPLVDGLVTLGGNTWSIYQRGLQLGNQRGVFSKVGDSITVDPSMYAPFAIGAYELGPYANLQPTVNTFRNSFDVASVAATSGWTTTNLLNPQFANPDLCQAGETPLACEYRLRRPTVALIMVGSNDVAFMPPDEYRGNLATIVDFTVGQGVIPVLSTIPNRLGFDGGVTSFNQIIRETAATFGVPLVDYNAALAGLPNQGLSGDGLHPSSPPDGVANSGRFNGEMLQFGYTMRNLVQLQALDVLRRRVY